MIFRRLERGERQPRVSLKVSKALYGGMECGRIFWEAWVDWHLLDGFQIIQAERCFLHKRSKDGSFIKLGYHVDDNLIVGVGWAFYQEYLARLKTKFKLISRRRHLTSILESYIVSTWRWVFVICRRVRT